MEEVWRPVVGYEGLYEVSNLGRIRSLDRYVKSWNSESKLTKGRILRMKKYSNGYLNVSLCKCGDIKTCSVHRLVAQAFLPNPDGLPCVNHKDNDRTNNRVENLEWCDWKYNNNYGDHNEKLSQSKINGKCSKKVYQFTLDGKLVREWPSTAECGRNGFISTSVSYCCRGERKTHRGFKWSY